MSVHAEDPTSVRAGLVVNQTTAATTRAALDATMNARDENLRQAQLAFDPSPAIDSLLEIPTALLAPDADKDALAERLSALLTELVASNTREGAFETVASGLLDQGTARLYATGIRTGLTVRDAAPTLRPHLRVLADAARGLAVTLGAQHAAHAAVRDVIVQLPDRSLRGPGLRNQLGDGPHDLLLEIADCAVIA
jgi:hypothetical protein